MTDNVYPSARAWNECGLFVYWLLRHLPPSPPFVRYRDLHVSYLHFLSELVTIRLHVCIPLPLPNGLP